MNKTYQFRLYPTKKQQTLLCQWLILCCQTYNAALQERRDASRLAGVSPGFAHQCAALPACKAVRPDLAEVNAQVLQNVVKRVDQDAAWSAFITALLAKVEETERTVIKVPPAYTTQTCHACGRRQEMPISVRVYTCENCGLVCDRDHNASLTILQVAVGRHGHVIQEALALEV